MANVKKGGVTTHTKRAKAHKAKTLRKQIEDQLSGPKPVSFISKKGADQCFLIPPGPIYSATGVQIGTEPGLFLDFQGVGVTRPYFPETNSIHAAEVKRIKEFIKSNNPLIEDIGLEVLSGSDPIPPLKRWDGLSATALKIAIVANFSDDHADNVELVKQGAQYEMANSKRDEVMQMLDGLVAGEAASSDAFDVEVNVK